MARYVLRRGLQTVVALVLLLAAVFVLSRLSGDPANLYLPVTASDEARAEFREAHGLDEPLLAQFGSFVQGVVSLDFGESIARGTPALPLVLERLPATLLLAAVTALFAGVIAIGLGVLAALRPGSVIDRVQQAVALAGASIPDFWLGLVLIAIFANALGVLPTSGSEGWQYVILPMLTLAARPIGVLSQVARSALIEQLAAPYVITARSKGQGQGGVLVRHTLRTALIPTIAVGSDQLVQLISGAVVVEVIFGWPGIGLLSIDAVYNRDFPVVLAVVFVVAVIVFAINIVADLLYVALDPRISAT
jgi:peptide/nickel transport system permease protein